MVKNSNIAAPKQQVGLRISVKKKIVDLLFSYCPSFVISHLCLIPIHDRSFTFLFILNNDNNINNNRFLFLLQDSDFK